MACWVCGAVDVCHLATACFILFHFWKKLNAVEEITGPVPEILFEYDQILKEG